MTDPQELLIPYYQPPFLGSDRFHIYRQHMALDFNSHWHSELEILYLPEESIPLQLSVDGREQLLTPGSAAFIAGTEVHAGQVRQGPVDILVIEFGFSLLGDDFSVFAGHRFEETIVPFPQLAPEDPRQKLRITLDDLAQMCSNLSPSAADWTPVQRMECASKLFSLAAGMTDTLTLTPVSNRRIRQLEAVNVVQPVLSHVERAYPEQITLEQAAAIAGYEKTRFCQLFKQAVGVPFHQYLISRRMRAAAHLLTATNLPIAQIGESVGIQQPKTFSRLVRATYGMTPSQLRTQGRIHPD